MPVAVRAPSLWRGRHAVTTAWSAARTTLAWLARLVIGRPCSVEIAADASGHFVVRGRVNGVAMSFLVDTGATHVALTLGAASRLGLSSRVRGFRRYHTANGVLVAPLVRISSIQVGPITVRNVDATILPDAAGPALLGMSFLRRLDSWKARREMLTLRG